MAAWVLPSWQPLQKSSKTLTRTGNTEPPDFFANSGYKPEFFIGWKTNWLFSSCCFVSSAAAQTGSWNILNAKLDLSDRWNLFGEAQLRSLRFFDDFHYYELKAGASFSIHKNFSLTTGFGIFDTYSPGGNFKSPQVNDEFRTWLQLNMSQYEKRLKFEHRYRAEQRWTSDGFRNRFRYRFSSVYPLNSKKIEPGTFYLNISDEIFSPTAPLLLNGIDSSLGLVMNFRIFSACNSGIWVSLIIE